MSWRMLGYVSGFCLKGYGFCYGWMFVGLIGKKFKPFSISVVLRGNEAKWHTTGICALDYCRPYFLQKLS